MLCGCLSAMMCYNVSVCVDLIITIRNPLIEGKTRMKYYHCFAITISSIQMIYNFAAAISSDGCHDTFDSFIDQLMNYGMLSYLFGLYLIIGAVSIWYAFYKLSNDIIPQDEAAKSYFKRHMFYIVVFWLL